MLIGQYFFLKGKKNFKEIKVKKKLSTFDSSFSLVERDRIKLIVISSLILIIFWASFEQAGGLMNLYAFEKTDRNLDFINFEVPASWFQSINPLMIILLGFQISAFWVFLAKKKIISSSLFKISVGIIIMGLGFVFMYFASLESQVFGKSSMYWLVLAYLFHTIGELCASPVILSYITKLSPKKLVASIMGIYFATIGLGNKLAGTIGESSGNLGETVIFLGITMLCLIVGFTTIFFHKKLIRLSHGIDN